MNEDVRLSSRTAKNWIFSLVTIFSDKVTGIILTILLAWLLSPFLFGLYYLVLAIVFIFLPFSNLGTNNTLIRYMSNSISKGDLKLARSFFFGFITVKIVMITIVAISLFVSSNYLAYVVFGVPELVILIHIIVIYLVFEALAQFVATLYFSMYELKFQAFRQFILNILKLILIPTFIILGYSVQGAVIGLSLSLILATIIVVALIVRKYSFFLRGPREKIDYRKLFHYNKHVAVGDVSKKLLSWSDSILIAFFLTTAFVGFYRISISLVSLVAGSMALAGLLLPVFTRLEGQRLENAFQRMFKYLATISIPASIGLIWVGASFIHLVYGPEYMAAAIPLAVLSFLVIEQAINPLFGNIFLAKEMPQYNSKLNLLILIEFIVLNLILIPIFGILGAAAAMLISRYTLFFSMGIILKIKFNIRPKASFIIKPLIAATGMGILTIFLPSPNSILFGIFEIVAAILVYFLILFSIKGFTKDDYRYLKNALTKN